MPDRDIGYRDLVRRSDCRPAIVVLKVASMW
jgi:hypothetical protein